MKGKLSWGPIGAGRIAGVSAAGIAAWEFEALVAVADIDAERAGDFAGRFGIPTRCAVGHNLVDDT